MSCARRLRLQHRVIEQAGELAAGHGGLPRGGARRAMRVGEIRVELRRGRRTPASCRHAEIEDDERRRAALRGRVGRRKRRTSVRGESAKCARGTRTSSVPPIGVGGSSGCSALRERIDAGDGRADAYACGSATMRSDDRSSLPRSRAAQHAPGERDAGRGIDVGAAVHRRAGALVRRRPRTASEQREARSQRGRVIDRVVSRQQRVSASSAKRSADVRRRRATRTRRRRRCSATACSVVSAQRRTYSIFSPRNVRDGHASRRAAPLPAATSSIASGRSDQSHRDRRPRGLRAPIARANSRAERATRSRRRRAMSTTRAGHAG